MKGQGSENSMLSGEWFNYHIDMDLPKTMVNTHMKLELEVNTINPDTQGKWLVESRIEGQGVGGCCELICQNM